jgi:cell wall-associated NlpC family hydrolase
MPASAHRAVVVLLTCAGALSVAAPTAGASIRNNAALAPPHTPVTRPVTGTTLSITPHHLTIHYNHRVRLESRLVGRFGPLTDTRVAVYARRAGRHWQLIGHKSTGNNGRFAWRARLRHTTRWRVRYAGDLLHDPAHSVTATIRVLPPPPPPPPPAALTSFATEVVQEAARHKGAPYQYGAAGPNTFDCSGFTMYVFGKFGVSLPHNAAAQYDAVRHVSAADKRLGDLVFFYDSSGIYHVGIYAGDGQMWAATHTGDYVRLESIYSASYRVGRVHAAG